MDLRNHCNLMSCTWYIFTFFPLMFLFEPQVLVCGTQLEALQTERKRVASAVAPIRICENTDRIAQTRRGHVTIRFTIPSAPPHDSLEACNLCAVAAHRLASLNLAPHAAQSTQHPMYGTCTACGCHGQDPEHMRDMARVQTTQSSSTVTRV